jgi:CHAT domain-containing protein
MGFTTYAKALEQQAVTMAYASHNDGIIASIVPYLAFHHAREGDYAAAEKYLEEIEISRRRMEAADGRQLTDLSVNLLCSQIMTGKGELQAAQRCLMDNLNILDRQERAAPDFSAETLLQLAEIDAARSQVDTARQYLRRAIEVIEENDAYLATTVLRMPFESQRRDIYDLAIRFEYDQGSRDSAWSYLQRYRSKLFLEFLKQMNSSVAGVLDRAIDRDKVQELISADVQVLEYVMLENRLLIWLVSRDRFDSISIPVSRREIEEKISAFLTQINRKADIERQSSDLYKLLIEPIEDRLDPAKKLAIVPDLALHRLNFPALYSDQKKNFLIQQYTILESPNLTTLLSGGPLRPSRGNAYSFGARTDSVGATVELRALGQIYEGIHTFNGQSALKPAFLLSLGEASVFHYAGHSQDAADPLRSSVLLDGEREGPNSVTAFEISKRKMPANSVVVLASCDSSVGNSRDGIGMRGLTSAFLISGAGSVVGSLWLVESESTSRLVLDFHRDFAKNGTPVAVALRNAQLAFIAEGLHPYYWSGFVVTGNASALR